MNSVFCGGVDSVIQASAAAAIRPISSAIGAARRTAGCAEQPLELPQRIGEALGQRSAAGGGERVHDQTGMLMMSL